MHFFVAFIRETLCDHLVAAVTPPPRRDDRRDSYGRVIASAADVYLDTKVRGLGLWVDDTGFKYFGVRPRRLPVGVAENTRAWLERSGIMIGAPGWVSKTRGTALNADTARLEAKRLLSLVPTLTPYEGSCAAPTLPWRRSRPSGAARSRRLNRTGFPGGSKR